MRNHNKLYYLISILLLITIGFCLNNKNSQKQDTIIYNSEIIEEINKNYKDIKTLNCDVNSFGIVPTNGSLFYEKSNNFRLILKSIFDKELDLGSNEKIYWFWIKRFNNKIYFWERSKNSQVIDEFDPEYVKESLGIDEIPKKSIILQSGEYYKIISCRKNQNGKNVIKIWIVLKGKIIEHQLYDDNKNLILICKIKKFIEIDNKYFPCQIEIISNQLKLNLNLKNIKINEKINESKWMIPNGESVDISQ